MKFNDLADLEILKECLAETDLVSNVTNGKNPAVEKEITCKDCGKTFKFSIGEQEFYKSKNFPDPKRCRQCSKKRRMKFFRHKGDK